MSQPTDSEIEIMDFDDITPEQLLADMGLEPLPALPPPVAPIPVVPAPVLPALPQSLLNPIDPVPVMQIGIATMEEFRTKNAHYYRKVHSNMEPMKRATMMCDDFAKQKPEVTDTDDFEKPAPKKRKRATSTKKKKKKTGRVGSSYTFFIQDKSAEVQKNNPNKSFVERNTVLSIMWKGMSKEEKKVYEHKRLQKIEERKNESASEGVQESAPKKKKSKKEVEVKEVKEDETDGVNDDIVDVTSTPAPIGQSRYKKSVLRHLSKKCQNYDINSRAVAVLKIWQGGQTMRNVEAMDGNTKKILSLSASIACSNGRTCVEMKDICAAISFVK